MGGAMTMLTTVRVRDGVDSYLKIVAQTIHYTLEQK
jgi:spore maturation protein SpmB